MSLDAHHGRKVLLRLYVSPDSHLGGSARSRLEQLCDRLRLPYQVEVVDVLEHPELAEENRVLVTPTLERLAPPPRLRVVGDLSDLEAAMDGLGLRVWQLDDDVGQSR